MNRKFLLIACAFSCSCAGALGQVFDAGYTFTYYFPALPSSQQPSIVPETGFYLLPLFQNVTATIEWEIFDSLPSGAPAHSGILHPGDVGYIGLFDQTWLDGEGSFHISILSNSQRIDNYYIYVARPETPLGYTVYSAFISPTVPEPGAFWMVSFGLMLLAAVASYRSHLTKRCSRRAPYLCLR